MAEVTTAADRLRSERGAELIEFALIFPLLLLVMLGIVDFGFMFQRYEVLTNAAREGARIAVLPGYEEADVKARVCSYLQSGGVPAPGCPSPAWVTVTDQTIAMPTGPALEVKRVQVSYDHAYMFVGPIAALIGGSFDSNVPITTVAVMRKEM